MWGEEQPLCTEQKEQRVLKVFWLYFRIVTSLVHHQKNHSLPTTSHPCHYTDCAVLAVSLLAKERNNVHAVELEVLTAAVNSGTDKTPAAVRKI